MLHSANTIAKLDSYESEMKSQGGCRMSLITEMGESAAISWEKEEHLAGSIAVWDQSLGSSRNRMTGDRFG